MDDATRDTLHDLAGRLVGAEQSAAALTGAGVSAPSDIPTFRGEEGIWTEYDPMEYGHISAFHRHPEKVWDLLREFDRIVSQAEPNPAHNSLARLERAGVLKTVITQNGDGLHQDAGNSDVVELHGTSRTLSCLSCGWNVTRDEVAEEIREGVPRCRDCDSVLKPDGVFFGESLPRGAVIRAWGAAQSCDHFLVVGTSAEVYPAAELPDVARRNGATIVEVNPEPALLSDITIPLSAETALPVIADEVLRRRAADRPEGR